MISEVCIECRKPADLTFCGERYCYECRNSFLEDHGTLKDVMERARRAPIVPHPRGNLKRLCDRSTRQYAQRKEANGQLKSQGKAG